MLNLTILTTIQKTENAYSSFHLGRFTVHTLQCILQNYTGSIGQLTTCLASKTKLYGVKNENLPKWSATNSNEDDRATQTVVHGSKINHQA